jgi:hypothetical protein
MTLLLAIAVIAAAGVALPPILIRRGRDRLAAEILARPGAKPALLTPADRCAGRFRRVPGVAGLDRESITFESRLESTTVIPLSRVKRVSSGNRMASGRRLLRAEVLTLLDMDGRTLELLMPRASVYQWRQHLGAWAARRKAADPARTEAPGSPPAAANP